MPGGACGTSANHPPLLRCLTVLGWLVLPCGRIWPTIPCHAGAAGCCLVLWFYVCPVAQAYTMSRSRSRSRPAAQQGYSDTFEYSTETPAGDSQGNLTGWRLLRPKHALAIPALLPISKYGVVPSVMAAAPITPPKGPPPICPKSQLSFRRPNQALVASTASSVVCPLAGSAARRGPLVPRPPAGPPPGWVLLGVPRPPPPPARASVDQGPPVVASALIWSNGELVARPLLMPGRRTGAPLNA